MANIDIMGKKLPCSTFVENGHLVQKKAEIILDSGLQSTYEIFLQKQFPKRDSSLYFLKVQRVELNQPYVHRLLIQVADSTFMRIRLWYITIYIVVMCPYI